MNLLGRRSKCRGISLTEYLVILALVAIAAIITVSAFGKQSDPNGSN